MHKTKLTNRKPNITFFYVSLVKVKNSKAAKTQTIPETHCAQFSLNAKITSHTTTNQTNKYMIKLVIKYK